MLMLFALALLGAEKDPPPLPDWDMMAPLRYREEPKVTEAMTHFVADEVTAGRCTNPAGADGHHQLTLDVAVLVDAAGAVRATVPHAINCPTVEQFGAGLVSAFARDNLVPRIGTTDQWYRTRLTFTWVQ